jgi:hypothetical protein
VSGFDAFREAVGRDAALQQQLLDVVDHDEFAAAVVAAAVERGYRVNDNDVRQAMRDGRRAWLERWVL